MLRYAAVYNEKDVYVEVPEDKFKEALILLTESGKSVEEAFEILRKGLEQEARRK
jgi:hypothetical protein